MTATVRIYRSTDASAPVLTGLAGGLLPVLDACLVNGYGSQTAAGWTKHASSTSTLAAYRMGAGTIGGTAQMSVYVDDAGTLNAGVRGYETVTGMGVGGNGSNAVGTGGFPIYWQNGTGLYVYKSSTADATARPWIMFATERIFHLCIFANSTILGVFDVHQGYLNFGAIYSYRANDAYNCILRAGIAGGASASAMARIMTPPAAQTFTANVGTYIARPFTGIGVSLAVATQVSTFTGAGTTTAGVNFGGAYPDPITGGMKLARITVCEGDGSGLITERGFLPGIWVPLHSYAGTPFDTFPGNGDTTGRNFMLWQAYNGGTAGRVAMEMTGSWDL